METNKAKGKSQEFHNWIHRCHLDHNANTADETLKSEKQFRRQRREMMEDVQRPRK